MHTHCMTYLMPANAHPSWIHWIEKMVILSSINIIIYTSIHLSCKWPIIPILFRKKSFKKMLFNFRLWTVIIQTRSLGSPCRIKPRTLCIHGRVINTFLTIHIFAKRHRWNSWNKTNVYVKQREKHYHWPITCGFGPGGYLQMTNLTGKLILYRTWSGKNTFLLSTSSIWDIWPKYISFIYILDMGHLAKLLPKGSLYKFMLPVFHNI